MKKFIYSKVASLQPAILLKNELLYRYFFKDFANFWEQLF